MNLREYVRAVAEAAWRAGFEACRCDGSILELEATDCDAIIVAIPEPDPLPAPTGTGCAWKCDEDEIWWTTCGQGFSFFDDGPPENGFVFCCYCGEKLTTSLVPPTTEETISDEERAAYARGRADARKMYEQRWEEPVAQHHAAPTCDGWWWAKTPRGVWWAVYVRDLKLHPAVLAHGESDPYKLREFEAWVGPLLPPDTTEPAPAPLRTAHEWDRLENDGLRIMDPDGWRHLNDGVTLDTPITHEEFMRRRMLCTMMPVATPTPDIDPEEVRRALDAFEREWGSPGGVAAQDGLTLMAAAREYLRLREQPAPDEELPRRGGGTIGVGTLAYFQANNENQLQQAMLRRVIALEKALGRERARALLCERLGVEAESLGDLLCARSDLGAISDVMLAAGAMFDVGVEVLPDLSQQLPIHGPVRLPSMPIVPQPAPDVQAVKLCNCGKCCPGPLYSQHERDAAVARERDRVIGIFVGELQKLHENTVLDCGDNSCLFATRRGGMRTNGGCRCIERLLDAAVAREREAARREASGEIEMLRAENARLRALSRGGRL